MAQAIQLKENRPYPNNALPVLFYPDVLSNKLRANYTGRDVLQLFQENDYSNGWTNGIASYHHFHSITHEVLGCFSGEAQVQLGGPDADIFTFSRGDVLLLPAGTAHKNIGSTSNFRIVGAYPNGRNFDMLRGDEKKYEERKETITTVPIPDFDPVDGKEGAVQEYWS